MTHTDDVQLLLSEINSYFALMPNAPLFKICRQQETKKILLTVLDMLQAMHIDRSALASELEHDLLLISQWDGVTEEPTDIEFQITISKVKSDLTLVKQYFRPGTDSGMPHQAQAS